MASRKEADDMDVSHTSFTRCPLESHAEVLDAAALGRFGLYRHTIFGPLSPLLHLHLHHHNNNNHNHTPPQSQLQYLTIRILASRCYRSELTG